MNAILDPIRGILINILEFFHGATGNYVIAIFLLVLVVKIVLLPLNLISQRSMMKTQKLQPEVQKINAKYKNDKELLNKKLMELYAEHNTSPFASMLACLPMLLSYPIIIALFSLLQEYFKTIGTVHFLWVADLQANHHLEIAIVVGLFQFTSMFITSRMSGNAMSMGKSMMVINVGLSIFITVLAYSYPVSLGIYWISFSVLSIFEQILIKKVILRRQYHDLLDYHRENAAIKTSKKKK